MPIAALNATPVESGTVLRRILATSSERLLPSVVLPIFNNIEALRPLVIENPVTPLDEEIAGVTVKSVSYAIYAVSYTHLTLPTNREV